MQKFFLSNHQVLKLTLCFGLEWTQVNDVFFIHSGYIFFELTEKKKLIPESH